MKRSHSTFRLLLRIAAQAKRISLFLLLVVVGGVVAALLPPLVLEQIVNRLVGGLGVPFSLVLAFSGCWPSPACWTRPRAACSLCSVRRSPGDCAIPCAPSCPVCPRTSLPSRSPAPPPPVLWGMWTPWRPSLPTASSA